MTTPTVTIRYVPRDWCPTHPGRVRTIEVDGQDRRICPDCLNDELRAAEAVLWADRLFHQNHDVKVGGCPYCYPGAVA